MKPGYARVNIDKIVQVNVEAVHILSGQCVTVWLDGVQVELRVLNNGEREIFCDEFPLNKSFNNWYADRTSIKEE